MKKLMILVAILAIGLIVLDRTLAQRSDLRSYVYFDDMYRSVAYKSQSENPITATGLTQRLPADGAIPRGYLPLNYGPSVEESIRAGEELVNPYATDSLKTAVAGRGEAIYRINCLICHGVSGAGDGPVVNRGYPPPQSLVTGQSKTMKDGQLFHILTYGYKNMPAYGAQVERDDRWRVIAYVRMMQTPATAPDSTASVQQAASADSSSL